MKAFASTVCRAPEWDRRATLGRLLVAVLMGCLLGVCAGSTARAQNIREAENIVDRRVARILEQFGHVSLDLPNALATDRDVYVLLAAGAAYKDVRVLARPGVRPETLARALHEAVRGTALAQRPVTWSHGDAFSAAHVSLSSGHFGAREAVSVFPAGRIVDGLRRAGYAPHVLLSVPRHVVQDPRLGALPQERMRASWWYDASRLNADEKITVRARLPAASLAATLAFFLFVPVVGALGLTAAVLFGMGPGVPIATRRRLYPKIATWPTFAAIALHAPFVIVFLRSSHPRVVGDLWFGTSSLTGAFMPFLMAGPLVMMLLLPLTKRAELRLFGPSEEAAPAAAAAVPEMSPEEKAARKSVLLWGLAPNVIGLALILAKDIIAPRPSPLRPWVFPVAMLFTFLGSHLVRWLLRGRLRPFESPPVLDPALTERAQTLAARMGVARLKSVAVDHSPAGRATANALVGPNKIIVTSRLCGALTAPEMDFVLAHEIAHLRGGHFARSLVISLLGATLLFLPLLLALSGRRVLPANNALATLAFLLPLFGFFVVFVASFWLRRQREHEADRFALGATGDLPAAMNALATMAANSPLPHLHEVDILSTHPKLSRRFAALRQIAHTLDVKQRSTPHVDPAASR